MTPGTLSVTVCDDSEACLSRSRGKKQTSVLLDTSRYFFSTSRYFPVLLSTSWYFLVLLCTYVSKTEKKYLTLGIPNNRTKMFREWEVSITEYFCSVLWAKIKWNDVYFSRTSQYFSVLLRTSLVLLGTSLYFLVLLGTSRYFSILLGTSVLLKCRSLLFPP